MKYFAVVNLALLCTPSEISAFSICASSARPKTPNNVMMMSATDVDRRAFVATAASVASVASFGLSPAPAEAASQMWKQVQLPFEDTLYDIDFDR